MTRNEKIEFLKGVIAGTRKMEELIELERVTEFFHHEGSIYISDATGEKFTEDQLNARHKNKRGIFRTVIFEDYSKPKE